MFICPIHSRGLSSFSFSVTPCLPAYSFTNRKNFLCLPVDVGKVAVQLAGGQQIAICGTASDTAYDAVPIFRLSVLPQRVKQGPELGNRLAFHNFHLSVQINSCPLRTIVAKRFSFDECAILFLDKKRSGTKSLYAFRAASYLC